MQVALLLAAVFVVLSALAAPTFGQDDTSTTAGTPGMGPAGMCPLMFNLNAAISSSSTNVPTCTDVPTALDMCLAPLRAAYGGVSGNAGDAAAVVGAGINNLECLIQRFFENGQNNFTAYFVTLCQISDFSMKCFKNFNTACMAARPTDATVTSNGNILFSQDPITNLGQMACTGPTLKTDVQTFLTSNNLNTCLTPEIMRILYKKYNDLRMAMKSVGATQMGNYQTNKLSMKMVKALCGVFRGSMNLVNMVALNATSCNTNAVRTLGFLFSSLRPSFCGTLGQNDSYSFVGSNGLSDRFSTNTTFIGAFGSGHLRTFTDSSNLVTCGQANSTEPITLLRLPYTLIEGLMKTFTGSSFTNFAYFSSLRISFFDKNYQFVDAMSFLEGATTIPQATVGLRNTLKFNLFNLQQDINIMQDTTSPTACVQIVDKNSRTFCRVCLFRSTQGLTSYYFGVNTLAAYLDNFGTGLLRDSCPQAQDISGYATNGRRRRREAGDADTAGNLDSASYSDASAKAMVLSEATMTTTLSTVAAANVAGNAAEKVTFNGWAFLLVAAVAIATTARLSQH